MNMNELQILTECVDTAEETAAIASIIRIILNLHSDWKSSDLVIKVNSYLVFNAFPCLSTIGLYIHV